MGRGWIQAVWAKGSWSGMPTQLSCSPGGRRILQTGAPEHTPCSSRPHRHWRKPGQVGCAVETAFATDPAGTHLSLSLDTERVR